MQGDEDHQKEAAVDAKLEEGVRQANYTTSYDGGDDSKDSRGDRERVLLVWLEGRRIPVAMDVKGFEAALFADHDHIVGGTRIRLFSLHN